MPTLIATVGGTTSNSYVTVAAATVYFGDRLGNANWTAATADDKAAALITATGWLESLEYYGDRASTTQALKWPRTDVSCDGVEADATYIPTDIQAATAETAQALITTPTLMRGSTTGPGAYEKVELGDLKVQYRSTDAVLSVDNIIDVLPWLKSYLRCWVRNASNVRQIPTYRN